MIRSVYRWGYVALGDTMLLVAAFGLAAGCSSSGAPALPPDTPATVYAAAYGEEQLRCVAFAATAQQADLCRYQVHAWWCTHGLPEVCVDGGWKP